MHGDPACLAACLHEVVGHGPKCFRKRLYVWDGCGRMQRSRHSSRGGEEEGQHELVAGPSGMPRPHSAVSAVGKRRFIAASCVPQAGEKIP